METYTLEKIAELMTEGKLVFKKEGIIVINEGPLTECSVCGYYRMSRNPLPLQAEKRPIIKCPVCGAERVGFKKLKLD